MIYLGPKSVNSAIIPLSKNLFTVVTLSMLNNNMTYTIWRRFYFMPRNIDLADGTQMAVVYRSNWQLILWFVLLIATMCGVMAAAFLIGENGAYLIPFIFVGIPALAYQIDPRRPILFFQGENKALWFEIRQRSIWRGSSRGLDLIDATGQKFGHINTKKNLVCDSKNRPQIEAELSLSGGKEAGVLIALMSLLMGRLSGAGSIGTYHAAFFLKGKSNAPFANLRRSNLVTGARELKLESENNFDARFLFALAIFQLEYTPS